MCTSAPLQAGRALTFKENHSYLFSQELMNFHHQTATVFTFLTFSSLELFLIHTASLSVRCVFSQGQIPIRDCVSKIDTGAKTEFASSFIIQSLFLCFKSQVTHCPTSGLSVQEHAAAVSLVFRTPLSPPTSAPGKHWISSAGWTSSQKQATQKIK